MKYTVDRIENDIVVLETFDTLEMVNVEKKNITTKYSRRKYTIL